jgi:glucose/arabinose dehydrogenase/azurin/lysophospholipase L1-like esterase
MLPMRNKPRSVGRAFQALLLCLCLAIPAFARAAQTSITYEGKGGPGKGKHVVFLTGDEEYRSEEGMPMLAKILSQRHGFKCTVLFALDPDGTINPNNTKSLSDAAELDSADAVVMQLRFRAWPDDQMKHFVDAYERGVPLIGLRTATHSFNTSGTYASYNEFGKKVLGERWVNHWGGHKSEATLGIIEAAAKGDPIMHGVTDVFGTTDVYEAYPPADAKILFRGEVLKGMTHDAPPADYKKKRATDHVEQGINDPMMAVAWTRTNKNDAGKESKVLCTTMGAATDLENESLRRLIVNGVYWGLGMDVPAKADVAYVDAYKPNTYGFNGFRKGIRPEDHALGKVLIESGEKRTADAGAQSPASATSKTTANGSAAEPLTLKKGDHVSILGNVLPDRMQHDGYLETLIYARFPQQDLVFRNLSASGDEVNTWHRSENFGSRDEWLTKAKTDVIFAFYGFNESFKGEAGLPEFKKDLDKFLKETATKNYNGKGAPKIVLFSPAADEKTQNSNFPDPTATNANVQLYAAAMAEVAKANGVQFVDLFAPTKDLFAAAAKEGKSLTLDGHYLTEEADKLLAPVMFRGIFDETPPSGDFEKLRAAINDKSAEWHSRYRTIDGYNVYGGRSKMAYESGKNGPKITNFQVMQEEMSQRDVMTANRDKRVWAVAQGKDIAVDDSNLPPVTKIGTNEPGPNPDGSWPYLSGEEAISKMKLAKGCKVTLFASEEQFPELVNPLQMAFDTKGRLWISAWHNYPERTPDSKVGDSLLIFEDTKGAGKADKVTHFLDDLNAPTGFQFYKDGVLVMQAPDVWFVRDTTGAMTKANWKQRVLMGMDSADSHHTTNAMALDPGGAVYLSDGVFHRTQVETSAGPVRNEDACIYRFEPGTGRFERYIPYGFANPHGRVFDYWGNDIITDATGNANYFGPAFSGHLDYPMKHDGMKEFWNRPSRPCPGTGLLTSKAFPAEFQNNFLNCNVIGFQGIYRVKMDEDGSGLKGTSLEDLISSSDRNFRPTAVSVGPDGAIYVLDWSNEIIGHLQHHLRDPNRDHAHGRIYKITYEGMPLAKPAKIDGQPIPALLDLLKEREDQTRTLAKIELGKHDSAEVIAATNKWAAALDKNDPNYEHNMMEALWVHQWHNVVDADLLKRMLRSSDPHARAAATRVLCYWHDRIPEALPLLKKQASDESPRVRLEAVRAASFFNSTEAVEAALEVLNFPRDYYIDYTLKETMKQIEPLARKAMAAGKPVAIDNPAGLNYLGATLSTADLLKLPRSPGVMQAILRRPDVVDLTRAEVLKALAESQKKSTTAVLLGSIGLAEKTDPAAAAQLARMLPLQPAPDLETARESLHALATGAADPGVRQPAWAALGTADQSLDKEWAEASKSPAQLADLLSAIPFVFDPDIRFTVYPKVKPLLAPELPADLAALAKSSHGTNGRYVRISLPHRGTLTLAEVQVFSEGRNIALGCKARQSTTSNGGEAGRAVDGNTNGAYGSGTETHTQENDASPWWEVDLGGERPIESVVVWNRSEGGGTFAHRLDNFTVTVLDGRRGEIFKKAGNPAPPESAKIAVGGGDPVGTLRSAAIKAAVSMQKEQPATFAALVRLIENGEQVAVAARGMRALPRAAWDKAEAGKAATALVAWAKKIPAGERTALDCVETVQFAGDLAGFLPPEKAADLRKELKELRVSVFVVNTVREQMRYDTARLVVEAGKPFEIILENMDFMPHNLVVSNPGTRPTLAAASANMKPDEFDNEGRAYVPHSNDILGGTKLVEPGQRQTLKLTAPTKEGEYEYFCTYPGHWELMWGRLIVTKDVDTYLQAHPDAAPAGQGAGPGHEHHH